VSAPLVSILVPAYRERFFAEAFASALAQTLADTEVIVCDDSPGDAIGAIVRAAPHSRVRYVRNPSNLGFSGNFTQALSLARGKYVKFLNDDDRLHPRCIETLAGVMEANPPVVLATSRRAVIDEQGRAQPDIPSTTPIAHVSSFMAGRDLGDFCLVNGINLIGEPTTVMFRRGDVQVEEGSLFRWGGHEFHCLADFSLWLRLMAKGIAYYAAVPLSEYRRHGGQEQRGPEAALECLVERELVLPRAASLGYLAYPEQRAAAVRAVRHMAAPFAPVAREHAGVRDAIAAMERRLAAFEGR